MASDVIEFGSSKALPSLTRERRITDAVLLSHADALLIKAQEYLELGHQIRECALRIQTLLEQRNGRA